MNKQTKAVFLGCGGVLALCVLVLVVVGPVALALRALGFRSQGTVDEYLTAVTPQPTLDWSALQRDGEPVGSLPLPLIFVLPQSVTPVQSVGITFQGQTGVVDTSTIHAEVVEQGETAAGQTTYYAEYTEAGANALADDLLTQYAPPDLRQLLRDPWVDFKPGVLVLHAEANVQPFGWQPTAVVLAFTPTGTQFDVAGVEVAGQFFTPPPSGPLADWVNLLRTEGNRALLEAQFTHNGQTLPLRQLYVDDNILKLIAQ